MIGWLLALGVVFFAAAAALACGMRLRGRRFVVIPPGGAIKPDPAHRQAIHHFASGVLPPWR